MVAPDILQDPSVQRWLGGIEPAWTLLDQASFTALHGPPSQMAGPIRLATDLTPDEIRQSTIARNALLLLRAAAVGPGLKLTTTGNLSRGVVAEMCERFDWPGFDKAEAFQFNKVINEPDFLPLHFLRHIATAGKLLRRYKGNFRLTPGGQWMLEASNLRAVQAVLFHVALWHLDLGYFTMDLHHGWPQGDAGIVLEPLRTRHMERVRNACPRHHVAVIVSCDRLHRRRSDVDPDSQVRRSHALPSEWTEDVRRAR